MQIPESTKPSAATSASNTSTVAGGSHVLRHQTTRLAIALTVVSIVFIIPLIGLVKFSLASHLYSHIPLIPFISLYLIWLRRSELPSDPHPPRVLALPLFGAGAVLAGINFAGGLSGDQLTQADRLCITTLAFLLCAWGACFAFVGRHTLRHAAFPLAFLIFMIPFPAILENGIVQLLQHGSAAGAYMLLKVAGTPVFQEGTRFLLPGISLDVAPECSGIRSSLVLFIVALIAGQLFLKKAWTRTVLAVSMIALGVARNALRIFILAQLCLHWSPDILDSDLHRRGGPVFFALSMIPFVVLLWYLRRTELRTKPQPASS